MSATKRKTPDEELLTSWARATLTGGTDEISSDQDLSDRVTESEEKMAQARAGMTEARVAPANHAFDRLEPGALPLAGKRHRSTEWTCRTGEKQLDHRVRKLKM
jgi:hypothetical protein